MGKADGGFLVCGEHAYIYTAPVPGPGLEHSRDFFLSIFAWPSALQTDRTEPRLPSTYMPRACRSQTARTLSSRAAAGWPQADTRHGQRRSPGHSVASPTAVLEGLEGDREENKPRGTLRLIGREEDGEGEGMGGRGGDTHGGAGWLSCRLEQGQ